MGSAGVDIVEATSVVPVFGKAIEKGDAIWTADVSPGMLRENISERSEGQKR
jgi:hypothetical protein